jgi:RNA recognition motif-containing protein
MANVCSPARSVGTSNPAYRKYIETYEVDKRSVHVGSLPADTEEIELLQIFEKYGPIEKIALHKSESMINGLCRSIIF